jgi:hypothetical protein
MRLIHTETLKLESILHTENTPYAILSHTWNTGEEVTFQEFSSADSPGNFPDNAGMQKILNTCKLAKDEKVDYAWVDTCCIDKTSSAEIGESINSMFQWYKRAEVCFVYLGDYSHETYHPDLEKCRWFTRGWTLQELLAPKKIKFYNKHWICIGEKENLLEKLTEITNIPEEVLLESNKITSYSIAQRMSWASGRSTTLAEDNGYCLLGVFNVNMPLIYGEGMKAFARLQEEIIKRETDLTLFAWVQQEAEAPRSILASSLKDFKHCKSITPYPNSHIEFTITNMGLKISTSLILHQSESDQRYQYVLLLGYTKKEGSTHEIGVYLKKIKDGIFVREAPKTQYKISKGIPRNNRTIGAHTFWILTADQSRLEDIGNDFRESLVAFYVPLKRSHGSTTIEMQPDSEVPPSIWDHCRGLCFRPSSPDTVAGCSFVFKSTNGRKLNPELKFRLLFDFRGSELRLVPLEETMANKIFFLTFAVHPNQTMTWPYVEQYMPEIRAVNSVFEVKAGRSKYKIRATVEKRSPGTRLEQNMSFELKFGIDSKKGWVYMA